MTAISTMIDHALFLVTECNWPFADAVCDALIESGFNPDDEKNRDLMCDVQDGVEAARESCADWANGY